MEFDLILSGPPSTCLIDFSSFSDYSSSPSQSTIKEILNQYIHSLLDDSIWSLPQINKDFLQSQIKNIDKFISQATPRPYLELSVPASTIEIMLLSVRHYDYKSSLITSMQKVLNSFLNQHSDPISPSVLMVKIDSIISQFFKAFEILIETLDKLFMRSSITCCLLAPLDSFKEIFHECSKDLKNSATRKKLKLKLAPGVEPPKTKQVQRQIMRTIKKPYTDWNFFSLEKIVEIEQEPFCVMVPFLHWFMSNTIQTKAQVITYTAPVGWEVTRIRGEVTDGNYEKALVTRTATRDDKGLVEVLLTHPKITKARIWVKVRIEGIVSQINFQEVQVPEFKTVLVTLDEDGEHEILPEFLEEIDN